VPIIVPNALIEPSDLTPFATIDEAKAQAMIADALAMAARVAPCITATDFAYPDAARAILRGAILRWNEAGTGAMQSQTAGPFGVQVDTRQQRRGMFWPSEIEQLQDLCKGADDTGGAFTVDTVGAQSAHSPLCALNFGAAYCDCGLTLTGAVYPAYQL
jgi:hypothetical protein